MIAPNVVHDFPLGSVCPCCGTTILDRVNISAWKGSTVCMWCRSDLDDTDAEAARVTASLLYDRLRMRP